MRRKKTTARFAEENRRVFSFDLKEKNEDGERKRIPDHSPNVLKGSLPRGPSAHPRNTEYSNIRG